MGREIVQHHNLPGGKHRQKELLDERHEHRRVRGTVKTAGADDPYLAHRRDCADGFPVALRRFTDHTLADNTTSIQPCHIRGCTEFIDKNQLFQTYIVELFVPSLPPC